MAIPERILEEASKAAQEAEVYHLRRVETPVHFEANRVKSIETREMVGAAVRLIKDGRIGFSSTTNLGEGSDLVRTAVETAAFGAEARFEFPGPAEYPEVPVYDAAVGQTSLEDMVRLGQGVVEAVRSYSDEVQVEGTVTRSESTVTLTNSRGGRFQYTKTTYSLGFEGTVIHGEDMLFVFESMSSCHAIVDPSPVTGGIISQLEQAKRIATIDTGQARVIFTPTAIGSVIIGPLMSALNGKAVLQGTSPLTDRLGERVLDERFVLTDDPTLPFIPGSRLSDDEGVPSRRLPLVEKGVPVSFFYDLQTAGQAGTQSTGSGERGLGSLPGPSGSVLLIGEGEASWADLLAEVKDGLVVHRLLGAGQSNILGGDFNANVLLGYKVEDGQVVGRVKNTLVSGNVYQALNNLIAIGKEGRWLGGGLYTPAIACANVGVASK